MVLEAVVHELRWRRAGAMDIGAYAATLLVQQDFFRVAPVHFLCPYFSLVRQLRFATNLEGPQASDLACRAPALHRATGMAFEEGGHRGRTA